jgi:hypothetical protein
MADRPRCGFPKDDGTPCQGWPKRGETLCAAHLGLVGRKPMLDTDRGEKVQATVTALLRNGNYIETACAAAGLSTTAFYAWMERGEADIEAETTSRYRDFTEAVTRARAEGEALLVQEIRAAGRGTERAVGDWKASAWILERTQPEKFGQRREVHHSGGIARRTEAPEVPENAERLLGVVSLLDEIGVLPGMVAHPNGSSNGAGPVT